MCLLLKKKRNRFSTFLATSYLKSVEKSRNKWGQTFSGLALQHGLKYTDCNSRRVLFCFVSLFLDLIRIYPPIIATNLTKQMKNLTGETQPCLPDLSGRPKTSTMRGLIVLPALPCISNILRKHFNSLHPSNRRHDVFKQPPFVAYRSSPNLRYLLVKAQLTVISNNHFSSGFFRYRQLKLCHLSIHRLTSYTFLFYE